MFFKKGKTTEKAPSAPKSAAAATASQLALAAGDVKASKDQSAGPINNESSDDTVYPTGLKLVLILVSAFMSMFLVSLDRMIITTAIPKITDDFHSITDIGWYGSAYLLTTCAFQLLYGKMYSFFNIKYIFLGTITLFETGSAICGAAPNSTVFIVGRAIAGIGGAGILTGMMMVVVASVPLHKRPAYMGLMGAVFGVASVIGPLLGGAFTSKVTWRWCFYINLPLGGAAMVVIFFLLKTTDRDSEKIPLKAKLLQLDVYGTTLIAPGSVCLILALQWGGLTYPWNDGRIIALLTVGGLLLLGFALVQVLLPKTATIHPRVFKQRSVLGGFLATICIGSQQMIFAYYLPIWFQAIKGFSAVDAGIRILPMFLSVVVASILCGFLVQRIGYYMPFMICGVCIMSVGAGLLNTLEVDTPQAKWVGYQFLYGWGMGMTFQAPNLAVQSVLPKADIPVGMSLMFFSQLLGGAVFISVGQNILNNQLLQRLSSLPGFTPEMIQEGGATSLTNLPEPLKTTALIAYNEALRRVFRVGLILSCLIIIGTIPMEWKSVKKDANKKKSVEDGTAEAKAAEKLEVRDITSAGGKTATTDDDKTLEVGGDHPVAEKQEEEIEK